MRLGRVFGMGCVAAALASCAYVDYARHWVGDFSAACDVRRVGAGQGHLSMPIETRICTSDPYVHTSIWMSSLTLDDLVAAPMPSGQILHVEMLFPPQPGETPIDPDATNLSIRYILISNGEVGIYEGGGFGYPIGGHESGTMSLRVEPSGLVLTESTDGFVDLLSPAELTAVFTGTCDDAAGHRFADGVDQFVTNTFGRTMYVDASGIMPVPAIR
ncbi:MAG: hypothetical protein QF561_06845 [Phycisphaerales bacterium]|nr:hypothetical protein [Phycisphaerales bacterium]